MAQDNIGVREETKELFKKVHRWCVIDADGDDITHDTTLTRLMVEFLGNHTDAVDFVNRLSKEESESSPGDGAQRCQQIKPAEDE